MGFCRHVCIAFIGLLIRSDASLERLSWGRLPEPGNEAKTDTLCVGLVSGEVLLEEAIFDDGSSEQQKDGDPDGGQRPPGAEGEPAEGKDKNGGQVSRMSDAAIGAVSDEIVTPFALDADHGREEAIDVHAPDGDGEADGGTDDPRDTEPSWDRIREVESAHVETGDD